MSEASSELGAKLLATENIAVMRARVSTASFDIKNRVLTLPQWKEMSPAIEGMLIGHEVGHALYTTEDYIDPIEDDRKIKGYLNVLEDVRIEKMIKRKYPGLRKTMNQGYKELNDKDFFGLSKIQDLSQLNLIDRINLYFKAGYSCGVKFTQDERQFVNQAERTETIAEVIELAKTIMEFSRNQISERKKIQADTMSEEDLADIEEQSYDEEAEKLEMDLLDYEDPFAEVSDTPVDAKDQDEHVDRKVTEVRAARKPKEIIEEQVQQAIEEELIAKTEESFAKKLEEFADTSTEYNYYTLDERHIIDVVVPYKTVLADLAGVDADLTEQQKSNIEKFKVDSSRVVNYLIKEFEMRKSATMYKRATTSKIGSLDMRKVWSYQLNDDLFKRVTSLPKGKNHGMIMLLDWSGSMDHVIDDTVKQVINLAMFCQRAQIPYQVFAFTTQYNLFKGDYSYEKLVQLRQEFLSTENMLGNAVNGDFALLELFSNKMSTSEFNAMIRRVYHNYKLRYADGYELGGTPLNEALAYMLGYIPKFLKKNNVEKLSLITLTDGEGGSLCTSARRYLDDYRYDYQTHKKIRVKSFLKDPTTKKDYEITRQGTSQTEAILRMIKERYGISTIGFYVCRNSRRDLSAAIRANIQGYDSYSNVDALVEGLRQKFKEEGFASLKNTGRDDLFIIPQNKLILDEGSVVVEEKQTARQIAKMFTKQMGGRTTSRVLLNKFIGYVA